MARKEENIPMKIRQQEADEKASYPFINPTVPWEIYNRKRQLGNNTVLFLGIACLVSACFAAYPMLYPELRGPWAVKPKKKSE
ncbi:hypothetical protein CDAR_211851 [Caerostris darwini]|uniref:Deltamethrin resistance protein prag01 domain-containing protein n=1 Tax=Caerostris darwini TaxID=1538125 RepID=A0AAV4PE15_9ARAC|nr:hypothetical protein CDAR_211851 [Caerostris darwini]